jgi:hypothetical protein
MPLAVWQWRVEQVQAAMRGCLLEQVRQCAPCDREQQLLAFDFVRCQHRVRPCFNIVIHRRLAVQPDDHPQRNQCGPSTDHRQRRFDTVAGDMVILPRVSWWAKAAQESGNRGRIGAAASFRPSR